ncbi:hypothetical protein PJ15_3043 [Acinetobacter sp. neg1]|uniref:hypothetical protein n=1 Tax=Acinetobacter TaxID=469 RepID=UPI000543DA5E|nr:MULTISPECIES: hypothetical protein [Acinetobacter]KHF76289.1 hypothetical protein PJ15_3043 [Acinetobacter sp. neg1]MBJ8484338.1 hypothetical protein [Acinetobacter vivianii]
MTDQEVLEVIRRIEASILEDEAIAKFRSFGEVALYANQQGYLKIAVEMLKRAIGQPADLHSLFSQDSDFEIDFLVNSEDELDFLSK